MAQLTKRGLIAAVVCSDSFMKLGTAQAKVFGVPDLPLLKIQHPLGGLNMDKVRKLADQYANAPLDAPVRMFAKPEDLIVIVTCGAGKHSAYIPTFGNTRSVTDALKRADGELVKSIQELKRG